MKPITVQLTPEEYFEAGEIGKQIRTNHSLNRARGGPGSYDPFLGERSEDDEIIRSMESYRAEFAVAKWLGVDYNPNQGIGNNPDVGDCIQVKWISKELGPLIIPIKTFKEEYIYVLVRTGNTRGSYILVGCIDGKEVPKKFPKADPGNRGKPAYIIQQSNLCGFNPKD